jgi:hypothetical protein
MPTDTETGITPVAADGEPNAASLDAKRAAKGNGGGGSMADRAAAEEQRRLDEEDGKLPVGPAGVAGEGEEDDGQTFVWEQGRKVTLSTLIARGVPIEHHFVFGGKRSKGSGGLMGFDAKPLMIVRGKPSVVKIVPTYKDDETVEKVAIENHVAAVIVMPADSDEGLSMISHILDERGYSRAGKG